MRYSEAARSLMTAVARLNDPALSRSQQAHNIYAGGSHVVEDYAEIHATSRNGIILGDKVSIASFVQIRPSGYYSRHIGYGLSVGDRSSIGPFGYIGCSGKISIGSDVMLAPRVSLFAETHKFADHDRTIKDQGVQDLEIAIDDDCWIGSGVIVTGGVHIGTGSVIGAGSVVTHNIPPFSLAVGNPARVLRER